MYFVVLLLEFGFFKDSVSPLCSMYEIFTGTYIWRKFMVNLGKYSKDVADGIVPNVHKAILSELFVAPGKRSQLRLYYKEEWCN